MIEERLFSTGDCVLDAALEEVYYSGVSDGYALGQKEFARAEDPDKFSKMERKAILQNLDNSGMGSEDKLAVKKLMKKRKSELAQEVLADQGDETAQELVRQREIKRGFGKIVKDGAMAGGEIGSTAGMMTLSGVLTPIGAGAAGYATGAAVGATTAAIGGKKRAIAAQAEEDAHKNDLRYAVTRGLDRDRKLMLLGHMSPEDLKNKWGGGYYSK